MKGYYICDRHITAIADTRMDQEIIKKFWKSFCQNNGTLAIQPGDTCSFVLGKQPLQRICTYRHRAGCCGVRQRLRRLDARFSLAFDEV